ncbi:hypothetical protein BDP27DRAFT_1343873 [Rhodocollybia butyracea]|uniref:DUF6924 domain-containing protein n=1 Tax=Rhodocollybia butyracea TaxID=206335 RepID=A0A9P5TX43_9AGAR|nr:hypothetical protein BDP27DRAFT_1343873 [Rhodocollybia butyracea]
MKWPVFITADLAGQSKVANRAFVLIQDFEYTKYLTESPWVLMTSQELPLEPPVATSIPLPDSSRNDFTGMSLADVNAFVRTHKDVLERLKLSPYTWLVIDQKGLETSTCIVCEDIEQQFRACRIPYEKAWSMTANLDIANMGFEEYVDEEAGVQEDGTWKWQPFEGESKEREREVELKREKALQELIK